MVNQDIHENDSETITLNDRLVQTKVRQHLFDFKIARRIATIF
jgi:hypothetical protein